MSDSKNKEALAMALETLQKSRKRIATLESRIQEPVAIIGMACRFPGDANSPDEYWHNLYHGVNSIQEIPDQRWQGDASKAHPGSRWAGLIRHPDKFDAEFFNISPREAESLDPQQRLLLEVAWESLENAGIAADSLAGSDTGVYVGSSYLDYQNAVLQSDNRTEAYAATGNSLCFNAGRISYFLGLRGPSMTLDTACSSALVALHNASNSLRLGESSLAIAGGVNLILSPNTMQLISQTEALSADGTCRTFDADANGFVRGEGCGLFVLKRLSDAERDNDRIHAVIRGSAVNHDGKSNGLTAPSSEAQQELMRKALTQAQVDAHQVTFIETHGTGTSLGDPIEVEAISAVYGERRSTERPCYLGALKTNLGHLESAAGAASVMKLVMSMKNRQVPGNLNFNRLNPKIDLDPSLFIIPQSCREWPEENNSRFGATSGFSMSGTNCHLILEAYEGRDRSTENARQEMFQHPLVFPVSSNSRQGLKRQAESLLAHLRDNHYDKAALKSAAYAASVGRAKLAYAVSFIEDSVASIEDVLEDYIRRTERFKDNISTRPIHNIVDDGLVFVFSGHGSHWIDMAGDLLEDFPVFNAAFERCDKEIARVAGWSVKEKITSGDEGVFNSVEFVQPMIFAVQVSLFEALAAHGVNPAAVVGHSMGEVAAAYAAGSLSLSDAALVIVSRSRLMARVDGEGAMLVAALAVEDALPYLEQSAGDIGIAVVNADRSLVFSGSPKSIAALSGLLTASGVYNQAVKSGVAFHSSQMDPLLDDLGRETLEVVAREAQIPIYSTVTSGLVEGCQLNSAYWVRNLRERVRLNEAIACCIEDGYSNFLELSPHGVLQASIAELLSGSGLEGNCEFSLRRGKRGLTEFSALLARLSMAGYPVDWHHYYAGGDRDFSLPVYSWDHKSFWLRPQRDNLRLDESVNILDGNADDFPGLFSNRWECVGDTVDCFSDRVPGEGERLLVIAESEALRSSLEDWLGDTETVIAVVAATSLVSEKAVVQCLDGSFDQGAILGRIVMVTEESNRVLAPLDSVPEKTALPEFYKLIFAAIQSLVWRNVPALQWVNVATVTGKESGQSFESEAFAAVASQAWAQFGLQGRLNSDVKSGRFLLQSPSLEEARPQLIDAICKSPVDSDVLVKDGRVYREVLVGQVSDGGSVAKRFKHCVIVNADSRRGISCLNYLLEAGVEKITLVNAASEPSAELARFIDGKTVELSHFVLNSEVHRDVDLLQASGLEGIDLLIVADDIRGETGGGVSSVDSVSESRICLEQLAVFAWKRAVNRFVITGAATTSMRGRNCEANMIRDVAGQAVIERLRGAGVTASQIYFGPVGAEDELPDADKELFRGYGILSDQQAKAAFYAALLSNESQLSIADFDARRWMDIYPSDRSSPFFAPLLQSQANRQSEDPDEHSFVIALRNTAEDKRLEKLQSLIRKEAAKVFKIEESKIGKFTPLLNLGLDSLMGVEIKNNLEQKLGLILSPSLVFSYPHLVGLSKFLLEELGDKINEQSFDPKYNATADISQNRANDKSESEENASPLARVQHSELSAEQRLKSKLESLNRRLA
ncbi:type I polyketide synthase [Bacterioplanoides sp.]|uniref:type I polyketide synthase n=1 Tax=Bacterioplanoides sp. TaxID=2066072 RepID=UPI003B59631F